MKQFIKAGTFSFLIIGLGLFIWTIIPNTKIKKEFTINPDYSLFSEKLKCDFIQGVMESKYSISYSKAIRFDESGEILVSIEKPDIDEKENNTDRSLGSCVVSLEVWIDGKGMLVEPGNRIVESFMNNQTQRFKFEIIPLTGQVTKGSIWIYAVISEERGAGLERIPLFAIPFTIQVQSLSGIPSRIIRIFSLSLTILTLLLLNLRINLNKNENDIILTHECKSKEDHTKTAGTA